MIKSFRDRDTERLFRDQLVRRFTGIARQAQRKLLILSAVKSLDELRLRQGMRLKRSRAIGKASTVSASTISGAFAFRWIDGNAWNVEIVDYH